MIQWPLHIVKCKYYAIYEKLISKAQRQTFADGEYYESHHIIPRSWGGDNTKKNLVMLTARQHYVAHLLLWKMKVPPKMHNQMTMALHVMVNGSGNEKQNRSYIVPSRIYDSARKAYSKLLSETRKGEGNHFYGKKHSIETIEKIKEANVRTKDIRSQKSSGSNNGMYGKKHSAEKRKYISERVIETFSDERKKEYSKRLKEKWADPVYKEKMLGLRKTSEKWLNRDTKAIAAKALEVRIKNGKLKMSDEAKKKMSETRKAKLASGEIVPWNKKLDNNTK